MAPKIQITSPIDDAAVGEIPAMDVREVDAAVREVSQGQMRWGGLSLKERSDLLAKLAKALRDNVDILSALLVREIAKTPDEATSEVTRSADLIDFAIAEARRLKDLELKSEDFPHTDKGRTQTVTRVPHGVVLAIPPFNYPINLAVSKLAPTLLMGNTVVFKPPTQGAVSALAMIELWQEAGLPPDVLAVVTGKSDEIGDHLVQHPQVDAINLTGSDAVGHHVAEITAMTPLLLELGGNDPALVLADADLELAAQHIAGGAFKYSGQRCTAVKRVYVVESVAEKFITHLITARNDQFGSAGDPRHHPVGPVISDQQSDYLEELLADAKKRDGQVRCGGGRKGRVWEATVVDHIPHESRLVAEEQFGPILPVVRVQDEEAAIRLANDSKYGLQASVFTKDPKRADRVAAALEAGGIHLNGPDQRGPDNFLFVGHKASGFGAQGVRFSLEAMSLPKAVVRNDV